jgi:AcrR family transcriptional regulator
MVQKSAAAAPRAKRGRPRAYDPATALAQATAAFWDAGYAATSLDDLCAATGMNRPSLYGAFGDKHALYRAALERYRDTARLGLADALAPERPLAEALRHVYRLALGLYFSGDGAPRGCFLIGTALTEAVGDDSVRAALNASLREIDKAFETRLARAHRSGELQHGDPAMLARLASAVLYFLAIRSRAGEPRAALEAVADAGVALICGAAAARRVKRPPRTRARA